MKVLHLGVGNLFGGIESMLLTLARNRQLCPAMEPSFTVCFEGRLSEELRATGVPVYNLGATRYSRPWTVWATRWQLARLLKRELFDVVVDHSCWTRAIYGRVIRKHRLPVAFWMHNPAEGKHWLERKAAKYPPDCVIANSRFTEESVERLFPGVPVEVIYPPVALPIKSTRTRDQIRNELATDSTTFVIVIACRLEEWKGHRLLIEALGLLNEEPNWVCWVVGGAQRESEKAYLANLKAETTTKAIHERVRWVGQRNDVPDLLSAADLYCQPNTDPEPFGISFVEALYAGLPVISTAIGGAVEIVDENCGELVPRGRADLLAEAIRRQIATRSSPQPIGERVGRAKKLCDPTMQFELLHRTISAVGSSRQPGTINRGQRRHVQSV